MSPSIFTLGPRPSTPIAKNPLDVLNPERGPDDEL